MSVNQHRTIELDRPVDLGRTLGPFSRGRGDPTCRVSADATERATRTPDGPAAERIRRAGPDTLLVEAWGPGAGWLLDQAPALLGLDDDDTGFEPSRHRVVEAVARRNPGARLGRTGAVLEALVPAILEQKVTGAEASRVYRRLVLAHGEPAPGPLGLRLQPDPTTLAALPYYAFHPLGLERRRAEVIRAVARAAPALEQIARAGDGHLDAGARAELGARLAARLRQLPGIGPWTTAEVAVRAIGDPDAVSYGDFHLPGLVGYALAGEPRADDARMLELLAPWAGQRARVVRLLEIGGPAPARRGPRAEARDIASI
jgi:3-methyladenine DNA glycosylase/8-oxoguanine DNA glycosylase